jgi:hypothetical protein
VLGNERWQNKYNQEIYKLYKEMELIRNIRWRRLQWVGHVVLKDEWVPKKAMKGYTERRRPVGRHRGRWLDAVDRDDKRMLKCRKWRRLAENRNLGVGD